MIILHFRPLRIVGTLRRKPSVVVDLDQPTLPRGDPRTGVYRGLVDKAHHIESVIRTAALMAALRAVRAKKARQDLQG
jgi:hypothetical protein